MREKIRWGIIGPGGIAKKFATGLTVVPDAELVAVGSRTQENADKFGDEFNVPRRYASYEALAADPEVDAVYVATPHPMHKDNSILCLQNGKAVLCEKPFTMNLKEATEVVNLAREKKLFLLEAMWTRYIPAMVKVRELIAQGAIGEVRMITSDFGYRAGFNPQSRAFDPALGGGALLDVGIYCLSLSSMIFGTASRVTGMAHLGETNVDEQAAVILGYDEGKLALFSTAVRTNTPMEAFILGTEGRIKIHSLFWKPTRLTLTVYGKDETDLDIPHEGNGYNYEAIEVGNCLRAGKLESDIMPLDETLAIMKTMDEIRAQWGLKYPME
jgi:predicted dehydrogenase